MPHRLTRCVPAAAGLLVLGGPTLCPAQTELWRQDPIDSFGGLSSQDARNPGGLGWFSEVADNFAGQSGWNINRVGYWGGYATRVGEEGNTEGFTVRFYDDDGGSPGVLLFQQDVSEFNETLYYTHPALGFGGYSYFVDLSPGFTVPADGQYWLSVVAILARGGGADEPQWGWIQAQTFTPPSAHQWFFDPGNFTPQGFDVSFTLTDTTPEGCAPDWNGDGVVTSDDYFVFLTDFFKGDADFSGDGVTDSDDYFAFLTAFFEGC